MQVLQTYHVTLSWYMPQDTQAVFCFKSTFAVIRVFTKLCLNKETFLLELVEKATLERDSEVTNGHGPCVTL